MAKLTGSGQVLSSGKGMAGLTRSWSLLGQWIEVQLPTQTAKARAAGKKR